MELDEIRKQQAMSLLDECVKDILKRVDDAISDIYTDHIPHIESDAWSNFRRDVITDIENGKVYTRTISKAFFKNNRELVINELNQDLLDENERLKREIQFFQESGMNERF